MPQQPEQRRILATDIPGPKSLKLQEQRGAELAVGLGTTMPGFVERAGGGVIVDVDGNLGWREDDYDGMLPLTPVTKTTHG